MTNLIHPPEIAAEFARIFAEQADLHRQAFRLIETLCTSTVAPQVGMPPACEAGAELPDASPIDVEDAPAADLDPIVPTERERAVGDAIKVAGLRPEAVAAAAVISDAPGPPAEAQPECPSQQIPVSKPVQRHPRRVAPGTKKDRVLDLYAEATLTTTQMSDRLNIGKSSVSAFISLARTAKDPRAIAGDTARRALRAKANERPASADAAPTPASPEKAAPRVLETVPSISPALLKLKGQVNASMKDRVLDLYAETGDHASVIAQKLGLLRTNVSAYIVNAGAEKDRRVIQGDRLRARRAGGRP